MSLVLADVDCGKVPPMLYGTATYINGTTYFNSEISYSCVRNYKLIGVQTRHCLENHIWSDETPRCEGAVMFIFYRMLITEILNQNTTPKISIVANNYLD